MTTLRTPLAATVAGLLLAACSGTLTPTTTGVSSTGTAPAAAPATEAPDPTPTPRETQAPEASPSDGEPAAATQPAAWPAPGAGAATPQGVAEAFVRDVLGVPPVLGEVQAGDSRSAEVEVFSPGEGSDARRTLRGRLLLRQLGGDGAWYVLAAVSEGVEIDAPAQATSVPAGPLTVTGRGRGYEAVLIVTAYVAGDPTPVAREITHGSSDATLGPYSATLDLTGLAPGTAVTIVVRGDTGLETDPGEHAAVAVVIAG